MKQIRRKEFIENDEIEIETFLNQVSFGYLATQSDYDYPQITPLNFVYHNKAVYFHSSLKGNKMEQILQFPNVSFAVADEYAIIPSWFTDDHKACPASSFFKSVVIYGKAGAVLEPKEKSEALQALMEKLQPEGKFQAITAESELYKNDLLSVAVVKIEVTHMNARFKFGQNLKKEKFLTIKNHLAQRNLKKDQQTIDEMNAKCPVHRH